MSLQMNTFVLVFGVWMFTILNKISSGETCMTRCDCAYAEQISYWKNVSNQEKQLRELSQKLIELQQSLSLHKGNLSSEKNKLLSAPDERQSSRIIGVGGLVILLVVPSYILIMDCTSCFGKCSRNPQHSSSEKHTKLPHHVTAESAQSSSSSKKHQ